MRFGTEEQRRELLPRIAAGTALFAIGMSEPDSGSDLAAVRTRATRTDGGWRVEGTKLWTSNAHRSDYVICLVRTSPLDPEHRHSGLSQLIVDLRAEGVESRPIVSLNGEHHFNEVHFGGVHVPDSMVLGEVGNGWRQVTAELAFERSGPERFLSVQPLLEELVAATRTGELPAGADLGRFFARMIGLHQMSISVARRASAGRGRRRGRRCGQAPGHGHRGRPHRTCRGAAGELGLPGLRAAAERSLLARPGYTLRGGTNEILRGVIARGLGLR
ncbi:acyl-CoA dehydrogenase family protein [Actinomadura madurae]|uniref:acyl-CoA dehydrogenase family protein n=1 Tax=Actinomadura madurae TaxID=1993 RepID=UPI0020D25FD1|nr:acyl-CoA dehydrogenase family protein [Actinomadura madurae]MCP9977559.1 acyl-CoA dehydrogenase family protein [Actinomadura madurae]